MASAMRRLVLAFSVLACLTAVIATPAGAALDPPESGTYGADGTFRKSGTQLFKAAQTVGFAGTIRIVDDEIFGKEYCPSTGVSLIQGILPNGKIAGAVVQYNWETSAVRRVQLVNKAWKCGGEVRAELVLYAEARCPSPRVVGVGCPVRVSGQLRLYEGTSENTTNLRRSMNVDYTMVGGSFQQNPFFGPLWAPLEGIPGGLPRNFSKVAWLPKDGGGKVVDQELYLKAKAGDSVTIRLNLWVQPTAILQL